MNYQARLTKLQHNLNALSCDSLIIEHPTHLLYLTGFELSAGKLLVTVKDCALLVDGRYFELCSKHSPCPVYRLEETPLKEWLISHSIQSLGFESDNTTYHTFLTLQKLTQESNIKLIPAQSPVQKLRWIKDQDEIQLLKQAARLGYEGYEWITSQLKEGIRESELAIGLEFFWKNKGAKRLAFDSIIAFGANGSMPHYRAGETILTPNMSVLIDIGVVWQHYHSDMTRVVFFGEPQPEIKKIYSIVEKAKQQALSICKSGVLIGEVDRIAREWISFEGYGQFFNHSLGHGLGLDIHEPPTIRSQGVYSEIPLQEGMVITIEPGIYLPGTGGVRLEDTILITPNGYENLTTPEL